jgi:phosphoenolpyruvate-protein kinase (PTS system EI component)
MLEQSPRGLGEPEPGVSVVEGIAIGRAVVWASDPSPQRGGGTLQQEHARLARSLARAIAGVEQLARLLPRTEGELFEPEVAILNELGPLMLARVDAGENAEDVVNDATSQVTTDLLTDARARLLDGLACDERSIELLLDGRDGECVLVTATLTPSVVASLPARVVGIAAASDDLEQGGGHTSHAVILARARDIPVAFVRPEVVLAVNDGDDVIVDATSSVASVWISPSEQTTREAYTRRETWMRARAEGEEEVTQPLSHLGIGIHVNIGSLQEHVPIAADGIGLVRTELLFSGRNNAPSEAEQFGAVRAIAARVNNAPVVVRLFDVAADKPLSWLRPPDGSQARGIELLLMHPALLEAQLRASLRAAERADILLLLPYVNGAEQVESVRARTAGKLPVGAMIEHPAAVERIDEIARASDFLSIGTNDLHAEVTGRRRADSVLSIDRRVLRMIERIVASARTHSRAVTVCGEMAGDPHIARILVGLGVDRLSVATGRFAKVKLSLREVSLDECRGVANAAMKDG